MGLFDNLLKAVESGAIEDKLSHAVDKLESGVNKMSGVEKVVKGEHSDPATSTSTSATEGKPASVEAPEA